MTKGAKVPPEQVAMRGFHGTDRDYTDKVLPSSMHGNAHYPGLSGEDDTYFLPAQSEGAESSAWTWAKGMEASMDRAGRYRVHLTEPHPDQHIDANLYDRVKPVAQQEWDNNARVAPQQKILETRWAPPPRDESWNNDTQTHVESTLPHINWRQMGAANYTIHYSSGMARDDSGREVATSHENRDYQRKKAYDIAQIPAAPHPGQLNFSDDNPHVSVSDYYSWHGSPGDRSMAKERQAIRADWDK